MTSDDMYLSKFNILFLMNVTTISLSFPSFEVFPIEDENQNSSEQNDFFYQLNHFRRKFELFHNHFQKVFVNLEVEENFK